MEHFLLVVDNGSKLIGTTIVIGFFFAIGFTQGVRFVRWLRRAS